MGERPRLWKQVMSCDFLSADIFIVEMHLRSCELMHMSRERWCGQSISWELSVM